MTLVTYIPPPPLSHYVEMFWHWENYHVPHPRERILPSGAMEIVIPLSGEPLRMTYPHHHSDNFAGPVVAGSRSEFFIVDTLCPTTLLAVWFKPGAALPFFKVSARELHNLHVPLEVFWRTRSDDLYGQLLDVHTPTERFRILEAALCTQLAHSVIRHRAVDFALSTFRHHPHTHNISNVVDQIGLSATRFIQVFGDDIGLTPKLFHRVLRFQEVLRRLAHHQPDDWANFALDCGYYDQSHFINDFQAFAGIPPTLYAPQSLAHFSNLPVFDPS